MEDMESRLPKPKFGLRKAASANNVSAGESTLGGGTKNNVQSKSTKVLNEVELAAKPAFTRAKTSANIARSVSNIKVAAKRPATTVSVGVTKRPNLRETTKPKLVRETTKLQANIENNKPIVPKPSKWDLKGRVAYAENEVTDYKEKVKHLSSRNKELEEVVSELSEKETTSRLKLEKLGTENCELIKSLDLLKAETAEIKEKNEELNVRLRNTEENLQDTTVRLKSYQDKCKEQEEIISRNSYEVETLKTDLEEQKNKNFVLTRDKDELQNLVYSMDKERRVLHNAMQELKGNIRVFCRVRPRISNELSKTLCSINYLDECTIEVGRGDVPDTPAVGGKVRGTRQEFTFDKVFSPNASQADIFEELSLLVQSALEGYNVCVFAYGQTGSGKTYTMEGLSESMDTEGMIPRTVRHIFKEMKQLELLGWEYKIEASFLEIYNEHIVDLLDSQLKTHEIRMVDNKGSELYVSNLKVEEIQSPEELQEFLIIAQRNRAVAATSSNERSSRSHSVARIRLIGTHQRKQETCIGSLNLVDLAGSERLKTEEAARTVETKNINRSLANLGNVILALLKKQDHVPYRNSKLTHLLMPSLGGNSKTLMLLNISPLSECYNETLNSLRFASNVNSCRIGNVRRTRTILHKD
ncbi:protein claret segregational [Orussus abietinus]|uniref:protein claret segregational n=1 Tax=Orussus abietinus TaxID=222816 RepID=UPI000625F588|nr:protein claret segregational [Orussus abietinus]XP_012282842.1 protein claret segregational [Orussus abietinus]